MALKGYCIKLNIHNICTHVRLFLQNLHTVTKFGTYMCYKLLNITVKATGTCKNKKTTSIIFKIYSSMAKEWLINLTKGATMPLIHVYI